MLEVPLRGGYEGGVTRAGHIVLRRPRRDRGEFTRQLLTFLEPKDYPAPRYLGALDDGREMLSFIEGSAGRELAPEALCSAPALVQLARLIRQLHDLTAGSGLAGGGEVVCHDDLAPGNAVYQAFNGTWLPVAFIDWGSAKPGSPVWDLASAAWHFTTVATCGDPRLAARDIRVLCDSYGFDDFEALVRQMAWRQEALLNHVRDHVANQGPRSAAFVRDGIVERFQRNVDWTSRHAELLLSTLSTS